jgi:D-proline reductase (dithiol) PrdB
MVRLADLPEWEREHMLEKVKGLDAFNGAPWTPAPALNKARVAVISTAGLHRREDEPFAPGAAATSYRVIPGDSAAADLVMSHLSINYDRTGFQQDWNVVLPLDRLRELVNEGVIGALARYHYSFMGAAPIQQLAPRARELAALLKQDQVNAVLLSPV